jgi:hypothetical protein
MPLEPINNTKKKLWVTSKKQKAIAFYCQVSRPLCIFFHKVTKVIFAFQRNEKAKELLSIAAWKEEKERNAVNLFLSYRTGFLSSIYIPSFYSVEPFSPIYLNAQFLLHGALFPSHLFTFTLATPLNAAPFLCHHALFLLHGTSFFIILFTIYIHRFYSFTTIFTHLFKIQRCTPWNPQFFSFTVFAYRVFTLWNPYCFVVYSGRDRFLSRASPP